MVVPVRVSARFGIVFASKNFVCVFVLLLAAVMGSRDFVRGFCLLLAVLDAVGALDLGCRIGEREARVGSAEQFDSRRRAALEALIKRRELLLERARARIRQNEERLLDDHVRQVASGGH